MILSMTGFAAVAADLPGVSLTVDLRSVNHRYLDLSIRLPDELRGLESVLRDRLAAELKRGKVECRISLNRTSPGAASLAVSAERVQHLAKAAADVLRHAPGAAPLSVAEILRWPGVLAEPTLAPGSARRARAGPRRQGARRARGVANARRRASSPPRWKSAAPRSKCRSRASRRASPSSTGPTSTSSVRRLKEAGLDPDEDRLKQELALFATKIDVAEEVQRLAAHVSEVRRVLAAGGSAGKRLDFLMQELHREANTLGSKSVDAELSQASLELKVLIEQMREQVQNVE